MKMSEGVGWGGGGGGLRRAGGGEGEEGDNCQVPTFIPSVVSLEFAFVSCTLQQMQELKAAVAAMWDSSVCADWAWKVAAAILMSAFRILIIGWTIERRQIKIN